MGVQLGRLLVRDTLVTPITPLKQPAIYHMVGIPSLSRTFRAILAIRLVIVSQKNTLVIQEIFTYLTKPLRTQKGIPSLFHMGGFRLLVFYCITIEITKYALVVLSAEP